MKINEIVESAQQSSAPNKEGLSNYDIIYKDEQNLTKYQKVQSSSAQRALTKFEKSYPNYRVVGVKDLRSSQS